MIRLDSHIHLFQYGYSGGREAGAELAEYESLRDQHDIEKALVVGFEGAASFAGNNDYILGLARAADWVVPLLYLDLARMNVNSVAAQITAGAAGFSIYLDEDPADLVSVDPAVWREIDAHGLIVSVNAPLRALAALQEVLPLMASTDVLISHLGLPGPLAESRSSGVELGNLESFPRVTVKLSGLYAIDPEFPHEGAQIHVSRVLETFGSHRIVWGSDYSPGLDSVTSDELFQIPDWISSQLSSDELEKVMGGTLREIVEAK
jgi:predicted TIM-barrel fold metal-dependent hydrolase